VLAIGGEVPLDDRFKHTHQALNIHSLPEVFANLITQLAPQWLPWGHGVVHKYQSGHGPQRDPVPERSLPA
jgi:hypothetical protein